MTRNDKNKKCEEKLREQIWMGEHVAVVQLLQCQFSPRAGIYQSC